ncbi:MAG: hypothetical protein IIZ42_04245, partial [Eubacterium sp.]|nr:hypothetical protein [Eubacterium sp.]
VTVVDNGNGTMTATAKVGDAEQNYVNFTNTYSAEPVKVDPPVQKVITGNETLYNKGHFTFTITGECTDPEGVEAPMPVKTTIKNIADDELEGKTGFYEFSWITFTVPGTYEYTVTESGSAPGVANDQQASKKITFTLTDENGKVVDTQVNAADGKVTFKTLDYTEADAGKTFTYTITEAKGTEANITYDTHTVTFTVKVGDNGDGTLKIEAAYSGDQTFKNTYTPPEEPKTGDTSRPEMWLTMAGGSLAGIIGMLLLGLRRRLARRSK